MELNLSSSITHNLNPAQESCGQLLEGFTPRVQLRETRSAYFIDVNLSGFRKEDIRLEMDNTRTLIIKGHRYLQGMGKVEWTWHLMESGGRSFRKPFRVPQNVNVGAMTGTFHQGVLHVLMPKFRWTSRFTPYHINRSNSQDDQNLEEAVHDEAKEDAGGSQGAAKIDDFVGTQSNEEKDGHDQKSPEISRVEEKSNLDDTHLQQDRITEVAAAASKSCDKIEEPLQQHQPATVPDHHHHHEKPSFLGSKGDFVGTQSNEEKDGNGQNPPEISTVEEKSNLADTHLQQDKINVVAAAASKSCDKTEEPLQKHQPATVPDHHHYEKPSCLGSKGDLVGTKTDEEKDGNDQNPPEISTVGEKSNLADTHLQQERINQVSAAASKSDDNTEDSLQQHQPATDPDLHHHEKPSCLDSKGEAGEQVTEEKKRNAVEDMGILTDHKEKDEQKDALNVLAEEVIAHQELACSQNSESEEDVNYAKPEPETVISSNGIDEYSGIISQWNYGETFWTRRKIVVALLVSSVAAIAAFKLMRR